MPRDFRERFAALARRPDEAIDLVEGALLIAGERYPDLEPERVAGELAALGERARAALGPAQSLPEQVARLNAFLFESERFRGNREDYADPRNSFLNDVLERRTGLPILLSLVYVAVARSLGLEAVGVGFPGHFLAKVRGPEEIVVDAFEGRVLSQADCRELLRAVSGGQLAFEASLLRAASHREILVRILSNLKHVYVSQRDPEAAVGCSERILLLQPDHPEELRDRGLLYRELECYAAARSDLERFLELAPRHESAALVREALAPLRKREQVLH